MLDFDPDAPAVPLHFAREVPGAAERRAQRAVASGAMVRVRTGVFAAKEDWATSSAERFRARIVAVSRTRRHAAPVLGYEAAALVHGLPRLGRWPSSVSLIAVAGARPPSRRGVRWHQDSLLAADTESIGGSWVTSLPRTLIDLARTRDLAGAVMALDHALHESDDPVALRHELTARLEDAAGARGIRSAREALSLADGLAQSPGESLSRVRMHELGFLLPHLQVPMPRPDGPPDVVDFDWPEHSTFGEMDGAGKYLRDEYARGRDAGQIVLMEKRREDRIRRRHRRFCLRWGWSDALHPDRLEHILSEGGIPRVRRARRFPTASGRGE